MKRIPDRQDSEQDAPKKAENTKHRIYTPKSGDQKNVKGIKTKSEIFLQKAALACVNRLFKR